VLMEEEADRAFARQLFQALHQRAHVVVVEHAATVHPTEERLQQTADSNQQRVRYKAVIKQ